MKTVEETKMNGEVYEAPQCEIIEMQAEGDILVGSAAHDSFGEQGWGSSWDN